MKRELNQRQQQILDYLQEHDGAATPQVAAACGLSQWAASSNLAALYVKHLVGRQRGFYDSLPTRWFVEQHGGGDQRIAVLGNGARFQAISINPEDAQLLEERRFQIAEVARIFGIPPHMLGDMERSTSWGSGLEEQGRNFLTYSQGITMHLGDEDTPAWVNVTGVLAVLAGVAVVVGIVAGVVG